MSQSIFENIIIIGGGWYGCHLAYKLLSHAPNVVLHEANSEIMCGASFYNQNRLHLGFHYPRCSLTRKQSKRGFSLFHKNYPFLIEDLDLNIYSVPSSGSLMDSETYKIIMQGTGLAFEDVSNSLPFSLSNTDISIDCNEKLLKPQAARNFFKQVLRDHYLLETDYTLDYYKSKGSEKHTLVVDCTWNRVFKDMSHYFEPCIMLKLKSLMGNTYGITLVDGPFSSIYPLSMSHATLSDVEYTPLGRFATYSDAQDLINRLTATDVNELVQNMKNKVRYYLPQFDQMYEYIEPIFSVKTKRTSNATDSRYTFLKQIEDCNILSVHSGKIDTIFDIEHQILKYIYR